MRSKQIEKARDLEANRGNFRADQSFHYEFNGVPFVIAKNLPYSISEGDISTIFEQYGTISGLNLIRDEKTGKSRGTAIIQYEDPRSAILAVDNFNATTICGRQICVDHLKYEGPSLTDPRKITPARLSRNLGESIPQFDEGTESSTESLSE